MTRRRDGFTLIEMLLTMMVLAVGLSSLFALLPSAANAARESRDLRRMDRFADTVFSTLQSGDTELFILGETRDLDLSGTERLWPGDLSADLVPPLYYSLSVLERTNQVREAQLRLRSPAMPEPRLYLHEFPERIQEWRP